jgi:hypothetical protein
VWVCVCVGFEMCVTFGNNFIVFTALCTVCIVFLYCFFYVYVFLPVLSGLPPSDNSIAINNNNNNNLNIRISQYKYSVCGI